MTTIDLEFYLPIIVMFIICAVCIFTFAISRSVDRQKPKPKGTIFSAANNVTNKETTTLPMKKPKHKIIKMQYSKELRYRLR